MAITRNKKEEVVAKIKDAASASKTMVFMAFKGLNVTQQTEVRRALRAEKVGYTVAKKSLMALGLKDLKLEGDMPKLDGEIALVYGEDELAPARELAVFVKKFPEQFAFAGGVFGGKYVTKEEILAISAIPGLQTLRAQFVNLINSPIQRFVVVLDQVAQKKA